MIKRGLLPKGWALAAVCISLCQLVAAQQATIRGEVRGWTAEAIPVVNLLAAPDSAIVKATLCDTAGWFEFENIREGTYLASVSHMGYQTYVSGQISVAADATTVSLPPIQLLPSETGLEEVQIVARKPFVQRRIDRVVVNPDALIGNAGTSSLDVLAKAPGVLVDNNGNISLKGKPGVVVFIDNKPTYMAAAELSNYLRSLPSGAMESIEIMTNPPAGYDAAGNAGIINIKLKKNLQKGFNGGINLSYGQGKYWRSNNSVNFNYRINKLNFFCNIGLSQHNSYQDLTINRHYYKPDGSYSSGFAQNSYIKQESGGRTARVGMDYYLSGKSTLGAVIAGFINPSASSVTNTASVSDQNNSIVSRIAANSTADKEWRNGSVNLNYTYKIDSKGRELSANADYISYASRHDQQLVNSIYTPDNVSIGQTILTSTLPASITIKTLKADYAHPLAHDDKIDAGFKSSFVSTDNTASFFDVADGVATPNDEFSNRFQYQENINAGYLNYARNWAKFSVQLGLRVENTNMKGHQPGSSHTKDSSFTRSYTSLFPTVYLAYRADSLQRHQFGFSFGRRIDRPNYQDLNPFTYPLDRYTYYGGNPYLQPTFSYNFELSHTYKNFLTTTLEYSIADNLIQETNEQRGTIFYSRPGNFGRQTVYGISVNGTFQLTKWWTLLLYSECKNIAFRSVIYGQDLNERKWYWYIGPTQQFVISSKLSAELAASYQTRVLVGQFLTIPVGQLSAGAAYKILKDKGTVRLNVSDIFYTNQPGGDIRNIAYSKANWLSYLDSRVTTLSFSYRFNKGKSLNARRSGGSETEKGRVKTS